jgi:hypothetical protein
MAKRAPRTVDLTTREAEARFHALVDELKLLTVSFPHLSEAYDRDNLPAAFILKRGRDRSRSAAVRRRKRPSSARRRS